MGLISRSLGVMCALRVILLELDGSRSDTCWTRCYCSIRLSVDISKFRNTKFVAVFRASTDLAFPLRRR